MSMWTCPKCGRKLTRKDQQHYCLKPQSVDAYISLQDASVRPRLETIRETIRAAVPEAQEKISWSMPTYWKGRNIIHFAASKKHIGLYPGDEAVEAFADRLSDFDTSKGTIRLPHDRELPLELIRDIARWCYEKHAKGRTMKIDPKLFQWTRAPREYGISADAITVTTDPHTDLWQRTYYHFRNDNAPVLQMETEEKYFSFVVKTDFSGSRRRFDQCGVVMYLDSENWLKGSVEYENERFQHLGSVVTNHGWSDWATTAIPADVKHMWYRFSRREDDYCLECSQNGQTFSQMRVCHMWEGAGKIRFGIYACSPEDSSFTAVFTDLQTTECAWRAHDGQQPDM